MDNPKKRKKIDRQDKLFSGNPFHVIVTETIDVKSKEILDIEKDSSDIAIVDHVPDFIEETTEDSPLIENEDYNLKSLGLVLSQPFSLKNINIFNKESQISNNESDISKNQFLVKTRSNFQNNVQIVEKAICQLENMQTRRQHLHSSNVKKMSNSTIKSPIKDGKSANNDKHLEIAILNKQVISEQLEKPTPELSVSDLVAGSTVGIATRKRSLRQKKTSAKCISCRNNSCKNCLKTNIYSKKLKSLKTRNKNILFEVKPCSIIVEKNIADQMRPSDICKVIQKDSLDNFMVCTKSQQNNSPSITNTYIPRKEESILMKIDSNKSINSVLCTSGENYLKVETVPYSLDPEKKSEIVALESIEHIKEISTVRESIKKNYSNIMARKMSSTATFVPLKQKRKKTRIGKKSKKMKQSKPLLLANVPVCTKEKEIDLPVPNLTNLPIHNKTEESNGIKNPELQDSSLTQIMESLNPSIHSKIEESSRVKNPESQCSSVKQIMESLNLPIHNNIEEPSVIKNPASQDSSLTQIMEPLNLPICNKMEESNGIKNADSSLTQIMESSTPSILNKMEGSSGIKNPESQDSSLTQITESLNQPILSKIEESCGLKNPESQDSSSLNLPIHNKMEYSSGVKNPKSQNLSLTQIMESLNQPIHSKIEKSSGLKNPEPQDSSLTQNMESLNQPIHGKIEESSRLKNPEPQDSSLTQIMESLNQPIHSKIEESSGLKNPESQDSSLTQIIKSLNLPSHNKMEYSSGVKNPESQNSSLTLIMESLKNKKALSFKVVTNLTPDIPLSRTFDLNKSCYSTITEISVTNETSKISSEDASKQPLSDNKAHLEHVTNLTPDVPLSRPSDLNSSCNSTLTEKNFINETSKIPSEDTPKNPISDTKKLLDLEAMLDKTPPFIKEIFKCDNIRDGFINEDLIFVLSLLPDMEEMADTDKLKFQLRVIETINDVLNDPVLKS